jgi:hypothetical protein
VWLGDDAVDPLEQAQTLQILVGAGIKTREEARANLGLAPAGGKGPVADEVAGPRVAKRGARHALLGKHNPHQLAQTLNILVSAGIKTHEEARADLGPTAAAGAPVPTNAVASADATPRASADPSVSRD